MIKSNMQFEHHLVYPIFWDVGLYKSWGCLAKGLHGWFPIEVRIA